MAEGEYRRIGRYEIEREIGRGGMAIVYKAYDPHLERHVAIKLIRRGAFTGDQLETLPERFRREARALAKLDHPNIVKVLDYGEIDGSNYLVMEFLEGQTLKEVKKPLRVETAVQLIRPIADALNYVHQQGILHRDVKPSNLMFTRNHKIMLTDFGIAKWIDDDSGQHTLTQAGTGIGTPEYMAPEQGLGKKIDSRADTYSLAIVFYELITGRKPFQGETPLEVLTRQAMQPFPDPREFVPTLNESVGRFFKTALAKDPADRYPTMNDFVRDLDGLRLQAATAQTNEALSGIQTIEGKSNATNSSVRIRSTDVRKIRAAAGDERKETGAEISPALKKRRWIPLAAVFAAAAAIFGVWSWNANRHTNAITQKAVSTAVSSVALTETQSIPTLTEIPASATTKSLTVTVNATETAEYIIQTAVQERFESTSIAMRTLTQLAIPSLTRTSTVTPTAQFTATPTASPSPTQTPEPTSTATLTVSPSPTRTPEPTPTATPKIIANLYSKIKVGDFIEFGRFEQDNNFENGPEPIEWLVLDITDETATLISKYGLDSDSYFSPGWKEQGLVNWENSDVRSTLNNQFFNLAFSNTEEIYIKDNQIVEGSTPDKVFILSEDEAEKYFRSANERGAEATDYARTQGAWVSPNGNVWWWLRQDGMKMVNSPAISADGRIGSRAFDYAGNAIRPSIRITIQDFSEDDLINPSKPVGIDLPSEPMNDLSVGDYVRLGQYEQDGIEENGPEPIDWKVLEIKDGLALIISEYLLDSVQFSNRSTETIWSESNARKWLNNEFFETVFSPIERSYIELKSIENKFNQYYGDSDMPATDDYVFLLSIDEAELLFNSEENRAARLTDNAIFNYQKQAKQMMYGYNWTTERCNGLWLLRTSGNSDRRVSYVGDSGYIGSYGVTVESKNWVRPSLYLNLKAIDPDYIEPEIEVEELDEGEEGKSEGIEMYAFSNEPHTFVFVSQEPMGDVMYSYTVETGERIALKKNATGQWILGDRIIHYKDQVLYASGSESEYLCAGMCDQFKDERILLKYSLGGKLVDSLSLRNCGWVKEANGNWYYKCDTYSTAVFVNNLNIYTANDNRLFSPVWNSTGQKFAVIANTADTGYEIFVFHPNSNETASKVFSGGYGVLSSLSWSADNTKIFFVQGNWIYMLDLTSGNALKQITKSKSDDKSPVLSHDGKYLAFTRRNGTDFDVVVMDMTTGEEIFVTDNLYQEVLPLWIP